MKCRKHLVWSLQFILKIYFWNSKHNIDVRFWTKVKKMYDLVTMLDCNKCNMHKQQQNVFKTFLDYFKESCSRIYFWYRSWINSIILIWYIKPRTKRDTLSNHMCLSWQSGYIGPFDNSLSNTDYFQLTLCNVSGNRKRVLLRK